MNRLAYHLLCFLAGAAYGWAGDGGHAAANVLEYLPKQRFWPLGLAWWVLPQFGCGGLLLSLLVRAAFQRSIGSSNRAPAQLSASFPSAARGLIATLMALATYLLSSVLTVAGCSQATISLALLASTLYEAYFLGLHRTGRLWSVFVPLGLVVALGGVGWESTLCHLGLFRYVHPTAGWYVNHWIAQLWTGAVWGAVIPMWHAEVAMHNAALPAKKSR